MVALLGLLLRVGLLIAARHNTVFADEREYEATGIALWKLHGFFGAHGLTAYHAPAQSIFIAATYSLLGPHPAAVKALQILLLTALPFLCARLVREMGFGAVTAVVAALLVSLHPALAYAATTLYPTTLTAVALTVGVVNCVAAFERERVRDEAIAGIALAVAAAATSVFAPLAVLCAVWFAWKRRFRAGLVIGLLGTLPTVAWMARNRAVMGEFAPATDGGVNLYLGANDEATPRSGNWVLVPPVSATSEAARDHAYAHEAETWIEAHPAHWLRLCVERGVAVADSAGRPKTGGMHSGVAARVVAWAMLPFVLLGLAGMVRMRRSAAVWFAGFALGLVVLSSAVTLVKPRFRFPCDPLLCCFAACALASFTPGPGSRREPDCGCSCGG
jgi:hypothetical protein